MRHQEDKYFAQDHMLMSIRADTNIQAVWLQSLRDSSIYLFKSLNYSLSHWSPFLLELDYQQMAV